MDVSLLTGIQFTEKCKDVMEMTFSGKKKRLLMIIAGLLFFVFYSIMLALLLRKMNWADSDKANHLYQAQDILCGNFFLNDWILSGVTFLFSDLIYYAVGYLVAGISLKAIYISNALMISSVMALFIALCFVGRRKLKWYTLLITLFLLLLPATAFVNWGRVHNGALCYSALSYMIVFHIMANEKDEKHSWLWLVVLFICFLLGGFSDSLVVLQATIPLLLLSFIEVTMKKDADGLRSNRWAQILLLCVAAIVCILGFDKLYFTISNADKNAFIANVSFAPVDQWGQKFTNLVQNILSLGQINIDGRIIFNVDTICQCASLLILVVGCYYLLKTVVLYLAGKADDIVSVQIAFGIMITGITYVTTSLSEIRYILLIPLGLIVLVIRNMENIGGKKQLFEKMMLILVCCSTLIFGSRLYRYVKTEYPTNDAVNLAQFLEENDLEKGYASFWNASVVNVASNDRLHIAHVQFNNNQVERFHWFCKRDWYHQEGNFIITSENDMFCLSPEYIIQTLGEPIKTLMYGDLQILVYNQPITIGYIGDK